MVDMADKFNFPIGLSDHTLDNTTAIASVAMGANIVEKHFTLDRNGKGPDDSFSLEPDGLSELCIQAHRAWQAVGSIDYGLKSCELGNVKLRRSLYFVKELAAGSIIDFDCVRSVRPGYGLPPKFLEDVIGSVVTKDVKFGTPVSNDLIGKRIK
jgi:N-acetylneuraminate synthase